LSELDQNDRRMLETAIAILTDQYQENGEFNEHIDTEEPVVIGESEYLRSSVLFWVDPEAYEVEKENWQRSESDAKHEKALGLIRSNGVVGLVEDMLLAVERGRVVPFVGAGLSKPLGMPLWGDALTQLLGRLPGADAPKIQTLIASGQYLEAAQELAAYDKVQTSHFIRTTYRAQQLKLNAGPLRHLPRFARGCLVTTNFDDAIEKTYEGATHQGKPLDFKAYMHGTQDHNFFPRLVRGDRCLLKLHGDAESEATHILTAEQYELAYGKPFDFQKSLPKALRQIYISQSLLFLGCGLEQDWTMELFKAARDSDGYQVPNHYAIVEAPVDVQVKQQKETRLLDLNIQPIWYPNGEHQMVESVIDLVADVAEKRFVFKG
jgi:hypothetical protein